MDLSLGGVIFIRIHLLVFKTLVCSNTKNRSPNNSSNDYRGTLGGMLLQLCDAVFMISIQILGPAVQRRCFEKLTLSEGFDVNRNGIRALRVGIDARSVPMPFESENRC